MKRFLWVPGALIGAVTLPLLMSGALLVFLKFFPFPFGPLDVATFFPPLARNYGVFGAGLGACSLMLLNRQHGLASRILGILCGLSATGYGTWKVWDEFQNPTAPFIGSIPYVRYMALALQAPLILWGLTLIFFALLLRSPSGTKTPSLKL